MKRIIVLLIVVLGVGMGLYHLLGDYDEKRAELGRSNASEELVSESWTEKGVLMLLWGKRSLVILVDRLERGDEKAEPSTELSGIAIRSNLSVENKRMVSLQQHARDIRAEGRRLLTQKKEMELELVGLIKRKEMLNIKLSQGAQKIGKSSFAKAKEEHALNVTVRNKLEEKLSRILKELETLTADYDVAKKAVLKQQALLEKL